jgi:RNA polymerase sigma-70 factor, ECF subfamily
VRLSVLSRSSERDAREAEAEPERKAIPVHRFLHSRQQILESQTLNRHPEPNLLPAGDTRASARQDFRAVFDRYSKPVLVFISSLIGDRDRAEELTQETFIRAYRHLDTMREDSRFSTWLFGIARNVVREAIKAKYRALRKSSASEPASWTLPDTRLRPDELMITAELSRSIQMALLTLPEDQRIVFVLKIVSMLTYEEISQITGASIGKLKTDLHRARLKMRRALLPYLHNQSSGKRGGP